MRLICFSKYSLILRRLRAFARASKDGRVYSGDIGRTDGRRHYSFGTSRWPLMNERSTIALALTLLSTMPWAWYQATWR